jgi:hypothetical protein
LKKIVWDGVGEVFFNMPTRVVLVNDSDQIISLVADFGL